MSKSQRITLMIGIAVAATAVLATIGVASVKTTPAPAFVTDPSLVSVSQTDRDVSGPCDEAEHANDPRCTGSPRPSASASPGGEDVSGPCDEAEHANDPRCTGGAGTDDRSGSDDSGSDDSGSDDSGSDDSGSGRGSDDDGSGSSGGESGSGHGGDDSSGSDD